MSFTVPRLYTIPRNSELAPTVADTDEGAAPSETGMTSTYDTVSINKFAGLNRISLELIDRSSSMHSWNLLTVRTSQGHTRRLQMQHSSQHSHLTEQQQQQA